MNNKDYIDIYNTIYGVDIIIANKHVTLEQLKVDYEYSDRVELDEGVTDCLASTSTCRNKNTGRYCILIKFNKHSSVVGTNKNLDLINTAAHEALHAALRLFQYAEQRVECDGSNEYFAYLVGWLTEKIYDTWTRK